MGTSPFLFALCSIYLLHGCSVFVMASMALQPHSSATMAAVFAIVTLQLLLQFLSATPVLLPGTTSPSSPQSSASATTSRCGNISIPYPFGIIGTTAGAHRDGFELVCNETYDPPKLFLGSTGVQVLDITVEDGTMRIDGGILSMVAVNHTNDDSSVRTEWTVPLNGSIYTVSTYNNFAVLGCGFTVLWTVPVGEGISTTCSSDCASGRLPEIATNGTCSGVSCCTGDNLLANANTFRIWFSTTGESYANRSSLVVVDREWWSERENVMALQKAVSSRSSSLGASGVRQVVPGIEVRTIVNWVFSNSSCTRDQTNNTSDYGCLSDNSECRDSNDTTGYNCMCQSGYQGNPYIQHGCQDIDECTSPGEYSCFGQCINLAGSYNCTCPRGTSGDPHKPNGCASTKKKFPAICSGIAVPLIIFSALFVRQKIRVFKARKSREFFFKQNRGLLLQRLVDKDIAERMIFTLEELERATNKFDEARNLEVEAMAPSTKEFCLINVLLPSRSQKLPSRERLMISSMRLLSFLK